jgi:hypothetical protein
MVCGVKDVWIVNLSCEKQTSECSPLIPKIRKDGRGCKNIQYLHLVYFENESNEIFFEILTGCHSETCRCQGTVSCTYSPLIVGGF